jgi:hypothetical protein
MPRTPSTDTLFYGDNLAILRCFAGRASLS